MAKKRYLDEQSPNVYVVQKGDTLSSISKKYSGNWRDYIQIANANNIENPDLIKEGQKIIIPEKFDKPLKFSEIPTKNRISVIDDYSPNYNYIVEGNKIYYSKKGNNDYWVDISDNNVARKNLFNHIGSKYNYKGYEDNEREIGKRIATGDYNYSTAIKQNNTKKSLAGTLKKLKTVKPNNIEYPSSLYVDNSNRRTPTPSENSIADKIGNLFEKGKNYISRQIDKHIGDNDKRSTLILPKEKEINSKYAIMPESYTGDTINVNNNQYIIPESINLKDVKLGVRNRGDNTQLSTEGAIITNFNAYQPYSRINKNNKNATYMGIDFKGNFKVGNIDSFQEGDMLTRTFANDVVSFSKNTKGEQEWNEDSKHGNRGRYVPVVNVIENGKLKKGSINILTSKNRKDSGTYGNITGGRLVLQVGDEIRLVSGSIDDIEKQFNDIKRRHNAESVRIYTLDNGSYNRGLRTKNRTLTAKDLKSYDNQNNGGGNFMYLRNTPGFESDTILTPNVRTVNDKSYKEGHPLTNEQKAVVLHHTAFTEKDLSNVTSHLTNPKSEASSHVIIGYDGKRRVLATPDKVTYHAGYSVLNNRSNVNDFSLGIEFQGDTNIKNLTNEQIQSAIEYLKPIIRKNNIPLENIVTHQQVRQLYNDFAKQQGIALQPNKPDINNENYRRVVNALINQLYYRRRLESAGKKSK